MGLKYLIPTVLEILYINIFIEGDFYEGDLLQSVLNINADFWNDNPKYKIRLIELINIHKNEINALKINTAKFDNLNSLS